MRRTVVAPAALVLGLGLSGCDSGDGPGPVQSGLAACGAIGTICAWAGNGEPAFQGDGKARLEASFFQPNDLAFAPDGRAYVVDWQNHRIRRINLDDKLETVMGAEVPGDGPLDQSDLMPPGAPGRDVELNHPTDVDFAADGSVLVAAWHNHKVRRLDPVTGLVTVVVGRGPSTPGPNGDGGPASAALLNQPKSVAVDRAGNLFVTDSRFQKLRRIRPDGVIDTPAGKGMVGVDEGAVPCAEAKFWMQQQNENPEPGGSIAVDALGRIYLADTYNHRIRLIDLGAGVVTTIAGTGAPGFSGDGGPATAATLKLPRDVEIGPDGNLYIADTDNHRVRVVDLATSTIRTVAGGGAKAPDQGGPATDVALNRPFGIAFDGRGDLFIADTLNNRIRRVVMK